MGSAAAKPRDQGYVADMFREFARLSAEDSAPLIADLLDDALTHPDSRKPVLKALGEFICCCYSGAVPDPETWDP